jgi:protease IV
MKSFIKYTLATITGIIIASILFFVVLLAALSSLVAAGEKPVTIKNNSILVLKSGVTIPDRGDQNPLAGIDILNMTLTPTPGLNDILQDIEKASSDPKIKGILIENGLLPSGWATTEEIRHSLEKFKATGKFVVSYADYVMTQECYYLATAADKIYLNPSSMLDFKGLSSEIMFYKKALDKIGVEVQVIRHGKFKGAVEPYILDKLSEENKAQIKEYTGAVWNQAIDDISKSRGISVEKLNILADKLTGNLASDALSEGLVDGLMYRDELIDTLKVLSGIEKGNDLNLVSITKYSKVPDQNKKHLSANNIAVIYASGDIVTGRGTDNSIGGNSYAEIIRDARLDTTVKAIVMRVNSPGGSAVASDIIWRELSLAVKQKPVVISMGNYAASGGYYISAPATKIYANPTTISGSIGVFGLIPDAEKLLDDKLGLSTEVVNTNKNSDFPSFYRPMNVYEKEVMQLNIEQVYGDFVNKVASGRKMAAEAVDNIGQGRVWDGKSAKNIGLVDEMGGLNDAINGAAQLAGIESYSIKELPVLEDPYLRILSQLEGDIKMKLLKNEVGDAARYLNVIDELKNFKGVQARIPYFIEIH